MNEIKIFSNHEFGEIRTVSIEGEPWLVGRDVAQILGYSNASKAVMVHVDEEDKRHEMLPVSDSQNGNLVKTAVINESGLYSLVLSSKLPGAKKFKRWVTSEVLPSIRKHGGYITGQEELSGEELMAKALMFAEKKLKEKDAQIHEMQPKALFADAVAASGNSILIGELAKMLRQNGVDMGEKRLFAWMRDNGYLVKRKGTDYNMPTQKSMEMGLFQIKETVVNHASGYTSVNKTPKVTGKGQTYFVNKFLKKQ